MKQCLECHREAAGDYCLDCEEVFRNRLTNLRRRLKRMEYEKVSIENGIRHFEKRLAIALETRKG